MIITPAAIAYGCLSFLALLFSAGLFALAAPRFYGGQQVDRGSGFVLLLALGQAALVVRLLAWPALYAMFASYVGLVKGSMCVYGVTQSIPALTKTLEVLEPAAFLVSGATLLLLGAYRGGSTRVTARVVLRHMAVAALLSLVASLVGLAFLFAPKQTQEVSCCSAVTDSAVQRGPTGLVLEGPAARLVLPLTQSCALLLLLVQVWQLAAPAPRRQFVAGGIAVLHLAFALAALFGPIAPVLTGSPDHHCAYCLVAPRNAPYGLGGVGLVLLTLATAAPIWLARLARYGEADRPRFRLAAVLALIGFWALVLVPYYR